MATVIIRKRLTPTEIKSCLFCPTRTVHSAFLILLAEGQTAIWFQARDPTGKVWNFELSRRPHGPQKPVIRGDWLNYVREKGLTANDSIILTMVADAENGVSYNIRVEPNTELAI